LPLPTKRGVSVALAYRAEGDVAVMAVNTGTGAGHHRLEMRKYFGLRPKAIVAQLLRCDL
jgi:hypothetical protein